MRGRKRYELTNHLGNVLVVVSDRKLRYPEGASVDYYLADIWAYHDYHPFGVTMQGRSWEETDYRYGFQGQEADDELFGADNAIAFTFRMADARIGRFLSIDPLAQKYPWNSPYAFANNDVISFLDSEGREPRWGQLANLSEILGEVKSVLSNNQILERSFAYKYIFALTHNEYKLKQELRALRDHFEHNTRYKRVQDAEQQEMVLIQANGNVDRYLYTTSMGWIDMHHFFYFAERYINRNDLDEGGTHPGPISFISEMEQTRRGNPSGFSYEDLVSNRLGTRFAALYSDKITREGMTLEEALNDFFTSLGAVEPEEAPNFDFIPHIANDNYVRKFDGNPLIGQELHDAHQSVHRGRPELEQENINEAHENFSR